MNKFKILIIEDNLDLCILLEDMVESTDYLECCGVAHDGEEGLRMIDQTMPDLVILDIILPKMDGISVLERLRSSNLFKRPRVIATSAAGLDRITQQTMALGADYYMIKPYDVEALLGRIALLLDPARPTPQSDTTLASEIYQLLISFGAPVNWTGFRYTTAAVELIIKSPNIYPISKQVYPIIANSNNTSVTNVDGSIRKMVNRIFEKRNEAINKVFPGDEKPSNVKFLIALAEEVKRRKNSPSL